MAEQAGSAALAGTPADPGPQAATPPPGAATTTVSQPGVEAPDYWKGVELDEATRGYIANKGYKTPADVVKAYQNAEKLIGDPKSLIKMPKDDTPEAWSEVYTKLGRPEKPEGYKAPEGADAEAVKAYAPKFHELGLSQKQFEGLAKANLEITKAAQETADARFAQESQKELTQLKSEWGRDADKNIEIAKRGAALTMEKLGIDPANRDALERAIGTTKMMKLFNLVGQIGLEDGGAGMAAATSSTFGTSRLQAIGKIQELRADPVFMKQYTGGSKDAMARMTELYKIAYPDEKT